MTLKMGVHVRLCGQWGNRSLDRENKRKAEEIEEEKKVEEEEEEKEEEEEEEEKEEEEGCTTILGCLLIYIDCFP